MSSAESGPVAFLFPGQGAQTVGMGAQVAAEVPAARALFDRAAEILGYDLLALCATGPAEQLDMTEHSQPALFVAGLAALEKLRRDATEIERRAAATAGLSLGEYTALVFAGVLEFDDALRVVQERGRAMQQAAEASDGGMVSILGLERNQVEALCDQARGDWTLDVANLLCPGNIVVSGHRAACDRVAELAGEAGAMRTIPLAVAGAFHTSLMEPAVERLRNALAEVPMARPRIPVVSNVDARPHDDPEEIRELLIQQVCSQVRWEDSMRHLLDEAGVGQFYELGPGRVLCGLLKRIARRVPCENIGA